MPAGTRVIRLFNKKDYDDNGFKYTSFKPTAWPEVTAGSVGARWDGLEGADVGVSYVATPTTDVTVVVWEVFSQFLEPRSWSDGIILPSSKIAGYAFIEMTVCVDLTFVDLQTAAGASYFGADISVLQSRDRDATRDWSRFVRRCNPHADGIIYTSTGFGNSSRGTPYVVFAPPQKAGLFAPAGAVLPVLEPTGKLMLDEVLDGSRVMIG